MANKRLTPAQSPSEGPSWLRNTDPLGIGLRTRAREDRAYLNPTGLGSMGPLRDPAWDAFLQSMDENADEVGGNQFGVHEGMFSAPREHVNTFDPGLQRSAVQESGASRQLNGAVPSLDGLYAATGTPGGSGWQAKKTQNRNGNLTIETQRGTLGNNQSKRAR